VTKEVVTKPVLARAVPSVRPEGTAKTKVELRRPVRPRPPKHFPFPPIVAPTPSDIVQLSTPSLGGAGGCDFRSSVNQLLFVEFGGTLSALDLYPAAVVVSSGTAVLPGTDTMDLDTGAMGGSSASAAIFWEQMTATERQLATLNDAKIVNLGAVDFTSLTSAGLQGLPYGTAPIPGNDDSTNRLVDGDVFAVRTPAGNLAKVLVVSYGYNMTIQWVTYQLQSGYHVLGTGYTEPEDVRASIDGAHAYVTERAGTLLRVDLANADRALATVIASGMTAPQQLFIDENAGLAYTVEYAAVGTLWRIDLVTGVMTAVITGLDHAVGVVVSCDGQFAYISEQTTGPDGGRVSRFRMSNGQRTGLATGLTAPFFLSWSDATQSSLYCPQRDPSNTIVTIALSGGATLAATGLAFRPSCVAVVNPGTVLVTCDQVIEEVRLTSAALQPDGPLLEGVGFVPFDWITPGGLANTTGNDPSYFFKANNAPFGGSLPVMVNFVRAALEGSSFYQVLVDGAVRTDQFPTAKWNGTEYVPTVVATVSVGGVAGFYEVPTIHDLALFIQPLPGCYLDSTNLADGVLHQIAVQFYDASGAQTHAADPLGILVDNRPCTATLDQAAIGASSATTDCGYLQYTAATKATDQLSVAYSAVQPGGFATWSFTMTKASNQIVSLQGPVPSPLVFQESVAAALGTCPTVAAFVAEIYATATATTGWGRCSQYDRALLEAFALAP
jgi:hypothetical protein